MRRTVILASLAIPLLAVGALVLVLATTESAPVVDHQIKASDSVPLETPVPAMATPRPAAPSASHFASTAVAPSPAVAPAAPGQTAPGRNKRSVRAAVLAAKLQHLPKAGQSAAPAANPARESLPPEEVAAMEAKGMDWRKLEQMMRGGVPAEAAPPRAEEPPIPSEGHDEETR
jgi:hypothetical protein